MRADMSSFAAIVQLNQSVREREAEIRALREQLSQKDTLLLQAASDLRQAEGHIRRLADANNRADSLQESVRFLEQEVAHREARLHDAERDAAALRATLASQNALLS